MLRHSIVMAGYGDSLVGVRKGFHLLFEGEHMENTILYGLFSDGGNCYSSRDDANWFWSMTYDQTRTEFRKNLKRAGELRASKGYREYDPSSIKVKVFTSREAFLRAAKKVGLNPKMED